ncbi:MAG: CARDB domain-containing protein, partial [bacterium]
VADKTTVKEDEVITVTVTVSNGGDGAASAVVPALTLSDATLAEVTLAPAMPGDAVAAGGSKTYVWKLTARKAGTLNVTAAVTGVNAEDSAALSATAAAPLALTLQSKIAIEANSVVAAPNFLDRTTGSTVTFHLRGDANATVEVRIYDAAGLYMGRTLATLDGAGEGAAIVDVGDVQGRKLGAGTYWAVPLGGGVKGNKPFMIGGPPQ